MTNQNMNSTLLALLLALKDSKNPLNEAEKSDLSQAAEQLVANSKAWEGLIEPRLLAMIQANEALNHNFQVIKTQIENLGDTIPLNLLPTEIELEQAAPVPKTQLIPRAPLQVSSSDLKSDEITNMAIRVLSTNNPSETTKKLSRFEQFQQFLNQQISGK
ncbi:hypothetical protein [Nostoc cycadae]|uniref:Uncharacterized protein n=1 Tax=Nostoc cycadae WK-1 TaxID=1861711 RepID=A0A2H6LIW9_9NOSO|nr:hypothetical protein [Nostoc cycadae]GBE93170.1 hypothetical protein NCWK1_2931 [Nostoc cycadae WK-1]